MQQTINNTNSIGDVQIRPAYDTEPDRKPQGFYINQMKEHATTEILNDDATSVRGSSFSDFTYVCNYISACENIRRDRVYLALRMIGYNMCYHEAKENGGDIFSDLTELIDVCSKSIDRATMRISSENYTIFDDVKDKPYRILKTVNAVIKKQSIECGIKTADINLYHALRGLKVLVDNEPDYILLADAEVFVDALRPLQRANKSLLLRKAILTAVVG